MKFYVTAFFVILISLFIWCSSAVATSVIYNLSGQITVSPGTGYNELLEDSARLHNGDLLSGTIIYDNEVGVSAIEFTVDNEFSTFFQSVYVFQSPDPMIYLTNFNVSPLLHNVVVTDSNLLEFSWTGNSLPVNLYGLTASGGVELYSHNTMDIFFANFTFTVGAPSPIPEPASLVLFLIGFLGLMEIPKKYQFFLYWHGYSK